MSIKLYTVKCSVHGEMEIPAIDGKCPTVCSVPENGKICNRKLKRIYDPLNVHYKGSGWASKG